MKIKSILFLSVLVVAFFFIQTQTVEAAAPSGFITINLDDEITSGDTSTVKLMFLVALLSLSSSIFLLFTHFTYVSIVLSMTRQALGTVNVPPNQVLVGLAFFISLYMMNPVLTNLVDEVWKPWDEGKIETSQALEKASPILKEYMLNNTYDKDLVVMYKVLDEEVPKVKEEVNMLAAVPAFTLTQIQKGLITGMLIYLAFVFIDMVISALLMYMGMMMLPPMMISLPFKVLMFVYIGGYSRITDIIFSSVNL